MKYAKVSGLILGLGLLLNCQSNKSPDNPDKLKTVLLNYFDGIKNKDFKKMAKATTGDFILYEMGRVWNNDSVFKNIKSNLPFTVEFKPDNFKINVDNMSGDITYFNQADFVFSDTIKQSLSWIESATFRKTEGGWKMNFLHITKRK